MGVYSTRDISRDKAIQMIEDALYDATNEELAEAVFELYKNKTLNNYWVYDTQEEIDELERQQEEKYKNLK